MKFDDTDRYFMELTDGFLMNQQSTQYDISGNLIIA